MVKVYLDANFFIDIFGRKVKSLPLSTLTNFYYTSVLTYHIFSYISKCKIPNEEMSSSLKIISTIPLNDSLFKYSLTGPTNDLEDNIQLHSAVEANCDIFLTNDKKLLKMVYFGKTKIVSTI